MTVQRRWLCLTLVLVMAFSTLLAGSALAEDFEIKDGVLVKYNGTDTAPVIPSSVTAINAQAFSQNTTVTNIVIPDTVTSIGNNAFEYCTSLKYVTLSDKLKELPDSAFKGCANLVVVQGKQQALKGVTIYYPVSANVTSMGTGVFDGCPKVVVDCFKGSAVETYAINNNIKYNSIDPIIYSIKAGAAQYVLTYSSSAAGSVTIPLTIDPEIASKNELAWSTNNASVAKVSSAGVVTATGVGVCKVVVASKDINEVTVSVPVVVLDATKGFQKREDGNTYHCTGSSYTTGWLNDSGKWYHFNDLGIMETGWLNIGDKWYYMNASGVMQTGWLEDKAKKAWFYMDSNGAMTTGWLELNNTWFYFDKTTGAMYADGTYTIDGAQYTFDKKGAWIPGGGSTVGWKKEGNDWYYYVNGALYSGWVKSGNSWYYMDKTTYKMVADSFVYDAGQYYYMAPSGAMVTGWKSFGSIWYFFNGDGSMVTGWVKSGSSWYYMDEYGEMVASDWVYDGEYVYYMLSSGAMATGWRYLDGSWYYFSEKTGAMATGWLRNGDFWYYFFSDGTMAKNTTLHIDGRFYAFGATGEMIE